MKYPTYEEFRAAKKHGGLRPADRIARSYVIEATGCWRWIKGRTGSGYGHFHYRGAYYQAHRLMYVLYRGPVPEGLELDHLCRNRWCVNPTHLEAVTARENVRRGIGTRLNPTTVALIHEARRQRMSLRAIGRLFGVDHSTVARIVNGQRWPEYAPSEAVA